MPKKNKTVSKKDLAAIKHKNATHNWDKVIPKYSGAGKEVDDAFYEAGYVNPAERRKAIIGAIITTGWADRKIAHSEGKEGKSGVRGAKSKKTKSGGKTKKKTVRGTNPDIQNCKKALIKWADNHRLV